MKAQTSGGAVEQQDIYPFIFYHENAFGVLPIVIQLLIFIIFSIAVLLETPLLTSTQDFLGKTPAPDGIVIPCLYGINMIDLNPCLPYNIVNIHFNHYWLGFPDYTASVSRWKPGFIDTIRR